MEHVHRSTALVVHARRRSRPEDRGRSSAGLDRGSAPRPGDHAHPSVLRQRRAAGRRCLSRSLRRFLSRREPQSRSHRHTSHGPRGATSLAGDSRGLQQRHGSELGVPQCPQEGLSAGGRVASVDADYLQLVREDRQQNTGEDH